MPAPQVPAAAFLEGCETSPPVVLESSPRASQPVPELYALLGVPVDATFEEVKRGYRQQALQWHPDRNSDREREATERFKRINEALDTLFDPERRQAYDAGQPQLPRRAKRLQGYGWAQVPDEHDAALTPEAVKLKRQSWAEHVYFGGRVGDVEPVYDERDPRAAQEKVRVFWRRIGESAHDARELMEGPLDAWLSRFVSRIWKDTPSRWPSGAELLTMTEASQGEWKERRMVYNRRKMKVLLHVEAHERYLATPDLERKIRERLQKVWRGRIV